MMRFEAKSLPAMPDVTAPDGSQVRILLALRGGSMAHFELSPGETSKAVMHRTVEEIWFFLSGLGEMWLQNEEQEQVLSVSAGVCLTIPLGTRFQFRACGSQALSAIAVTMPPWPGGEEARTVEGKWPPTVS